MDLPDHDDTEDDAAGKCHVDPSLARAWEVMRKGTVGSGTARLAANVTRILMHFVGNVKESTLEMGTKDGEKLHIIQSSAGDWRH